MQPLAFAGLVSARNYEISRLSVCPVQPSLLILESPYTDQYQHYLRNQPQFNQHYQLIDRNQFGVQHPACRALPMGSMQGFVDDIFAMYIMSIENKNQQLSVRIMRTDTGAIIYEKWMKQPSDPEKVLATITAEWLPALVKQPSHCLNQFTAMLTQDVQMRCHGQLPSLTEYDVSSDFRLIFEMVSLDITARDQSQTIHGHMMIDPKPARVIQRIALKQQQPPCLLRMLSEKVLEIQLQPRKLAALLHVTIPKNLSQPWKFEPQIISAEPFFTGDAVEENVLTTNGGDACPERSGQQKEVQQLIYADTNLFKFALQEMNPFCSPSDFIRPVFARAPNLGTPNNVDITSGCTNSAMASTMTFKRRFYR